MRIIADSIIGEAVSITATNIKSFADTDRMQNYHLVDKSEFNTGDTTITIDLGTCGCAVNALALCGTNISDGATLSLSYSDTSPLAPENTIPLPVFSSFNQVWFLDSELVKRYWVIDISDPSPQDAAGINIGYIKAGVYTQVDAVIFPSEPVLNIADKPSVSPTGQGYGSKGVVIEDFAATIQTDEAGAEAILDIVRSNQRIEPVLWVPFEDSINKSLYPPRFGVLNTESYPYPVDGAFDLFQISISLSERF